MLTLTEAAHAALEEFFATQPRNAVRIYLAPGSTGQRLALVMDEPDDEEDAVCTVQGFTFCMHKNVLAKVGGVVLDVVNDEFVPLPRIALPTVKASGCTACVGRGVGNCGSCTGQGAE
ncbi:MAG: IscA/HesB family protein [Desulfovibrionaceae bacterium]|nr:IscA/HesB family protein [Desulfovibrionaceae bacterium]